MTLNWYLPKAKFIEKTVHIWQFCKFIKKNWSWE